MAVTPNSGEMLTVMILDVDLANRVVHVKDKTGSSYQATFRASGSFLQIPVVNEYWTVTRIGFQWFLGTKVEDRSDDLTTLHQGDVRIKTDGTIHLDPGPDGTVLINGEEIGAGGSGVPDGGTTGQVLTKLSDTNGDADWEDPTSGGVTDHGALTGLGDDDHPQYHNDARGDARYWQLSTDLATQAELDAHKSSSDHDSRYYTETEVDAALAGKQNTITTGSLPISTLDIDGGTDIGAALADVDLIIVDDGAGGTNRKSAMSRVWTYISGKLTGAVSSVLTSDLTTSRAVVSDGSGKISASSTTSTEVGYLSGVTGAIQTQIDGKQPLDSDLTTIAGLTATTDNFLQAKAGAWASRTVSQVVSDLVTGGLLTSSTAASTYAPIASPTFTGDPKAPTPASSDNDTSIATTAFVKAQKIHDLTLPTAATPMNGQKFTGLGAGSANGDSLRYEQLFTTGTVTLLGGLAISSPNGLYLNTATIRSKGGNDLVVQTLNASDNFWVENQLSLIARNTDVTVEGGWSDAPDLNFASYYDSTVGGFISASDYYMWLSMEMKSAGASPSADLAVYNNSNTRVAAFQDDGRFVLPVTGSTAGVLLGGDAHLYRGAANTITVGSGDKIQQNAAPTAADDLTNKTYVDSSDLIYARRSFFGF